MFAVPNVISLIAGETYTVHWNGTNYTCIAHGSAEDGNMGIFLGNSAAIEGSMTTDDPFVVAALFPEGAAEMGCGILAVPLDGSTSLTLSITGPVEVVHPLDEKYLPKAAIPANGKVVFTRDDAGNCTCDKTYEEIGMMFASGIFPWAQLNGVANDGCPIFLKDFQVASVGIQFNTTAYFQLANNGLSGVYHVFINIAESGEISCSVSRLDASMVTL
jgi:hypothetical protein